uniref:NAD-dependent epimerase n=1 Tax=Fulvivirga sp. TaxID=1931237 RepID=UPI0040499B99
MKILITGAAGFIGFHLSKRLMHEGHSVVGIDNLNDYYEPTLKQDRLAILKENSRFSFHKIDITDYAGLCQLFETDKFDAVVNLAAQAGVRYSIENPKAYIDANIVGFNNVLECCRHFKAGQLIYASSSSVYGANTSMPFSVHDNVDHPLSLYAASKKSNELMAHTYASLYNLPVTGLRFFTVYGPWGRPDMALFLFTKAIVEGKPINVFNHGKMQRDFTYVDDIVEGIYRLTQQLPKPNPDWDGAKPDPSSSFAPYRLYNIGNNNPVQLGYFISLIEKELGKEAIKNMMELQPGDVPATYADIDALIKDVGYKPATPIETGIRNFVNWYKDYYGLSV